MAAGRVRIFNYSKVNFSTKGRVESARLRRSLPRIRVVNFGELGGEGRLFHRPTGDKNYLKGLLGISLPDGSEIRIWGCAGRAVCGLSEQNFCRNLLSVLRPASSEIGGESERLDGQNFSPS